MVIKQSKRQIPLFFPIGHPKLYHYKIFGGQLVEYPILVFNGRYANSLTHTILHLFTWVLWSLLGGHELFH